MITRCLAPATWKVFFCFFLRAAWRLPLETLFGFWASATSDTCPMFTLWRLLFRKCMQRFHICSTWAECCSTSLLKCYNFTILFQTAFQGLDFARVKEKESGHYHHRNWSLVKYLSKTLTTGEKVGRKWCGNVKMKMWKSGAENGVEIRRPWKYKVQWA